MNKFRTLKADEIDCRISQIKDRDGKPLGLSLLLYKDARCDQNILDETVGPMNWMRHHLRDNRNCIVAIWDKDKKQWIEKEDTGTESNTEKEKGLASDSFKRACFNWGIGRELYTAPFIWVKADDCTIRKDSRGKLACYDRFTVKNISYTDGVITGLEVKNQATGKVCYKWGEITEEGEAPEKPEQPDNEPEEKPPVPKPNATVEKTGTLPSKNPVVNYIRNEIADIQETVGAESYQAARKAVFGWVDELVKANALSPVDWQNISMEEAKNVFSAVRLTFLGDAA